MNQRSGFRGTRRSLLLPIMLILISLTFVGAVLCSDLRQTVPPIDKDTLCRTDVALEYHAVLVVDATDAFTRDQVARLRASVSEERASLPKFGRLTVLFVTATKPFEPEEIISLCNPGSGADADPLTSNPGQLASIWQHKFAEPIDAAAARLINLPPAKRSPILESVTAATWRYDFDSRVPHRRLRIVSDLLQHEYGAYSHYKTGDPWLRFTRSAFAKKVEADLTGVTVRIDYFKRPEALQYQNEAHVRFWRRWLMGRGAASVDFGAAFLPPVADSVAVRESTRLGRSP